MNKEINHGYIEPVVLPEDYRFGLGQVSLAQPLQLNGQWDEYLPIDEIQNRNGLETFGCTLYGSMSQLEILLRKLFNS